MLKRLCEEEEEDVASVSLIPPLAAPNPKRRAIGRHTKPDDYAELTCAAR